MTTFYGQAAINPVFGVSTPTFSDTNDIAFPSRHVYFNEPGVVRLMLKDGSTVDLNVLAGVQLSAEVLRVFSSGTTVPAGSVVLLK